MPGLPAQGDNLDTMRQRNLSKVLGFVHRGSRVPRSELTRAIGLNRSTVGDLVGELVDLRLVVETVPNDHHRVGRPSWIVSPHPGVVALAVNPEVEGVTVGVVGFDGVVRRRMRRETTRAPRPEEVVAMVIAMIDELRPELATYLRTVGIGVALPGLVRESDGAIPLASHFGWVDVPLGKMLADATGLSVHVANNARLGADAERLFGAGRGASDLIFLNGGPSGIGAGVIAGGIPLTGTSGYAGEFGHTLVNNAGDRCQCGAFGCLETEVNQSSLFGVLGLPPATEIDDLDRALTLSESSAVAAEVERQLGFLAIVLRNAVNVLNPELIVLGGFLGALFAAAPERLVFLVAERALGASVEQVEIVRSELGANLLMVGAAELAFASLIDDPAGVTSPF
ncbi:MAG: hypothetical protein QOE16_977 [Microbacteriaceae bacterium]|jgi:predicted NBD/HSP70 family sugar kinase|nr:hypothetical protein [Microbacteriaceae bacterium]